jgi:hypothetical protein
VRFKVAEVSAFTLAVISIRHRVIKVMNDIFKIELLVRFVIKIIILELLEKIICAGVAGLVMEDLTQYKSDRYWPIKLSL